MRNYVIQYQDFPWTYTAEVINVVYGTFKIISKCKINSRSTPIIVIYDVSHHNNENMSKILARCYGVYLGGYDKNKRTKCKIISSLIHLALECSEIIPEEHGGIEAIIDDHLPCFW